MASEPPDASLAFLLDAPMQAWGASSRFQRRNTESFPTKSGVLGLLAAALGIDKHAPDEAGRIEPLAALRFSTAAFRVAGSDRDVARFEDFHTVGGGYDRNSPLEVLRISRKASGGPSTTVITRRTYLADARFVALLEGGQALLEQCAAALENPLWGVWFGRKSCLPAAPLGPVVAPTREEAISRLLGRAFPERQIVMGNGQGDASQPAGDGIWFQPDHPISFGRREFRSRAVSRSSEPLSD